MRSGNTHQPSFHPSPLALLSVALAAGILLEKIWTLPPAIPLVASALLTLLTIFAYLRRALVRASWLILTAFMMAGCGLAAVEHRRSSETTLGRRLATGEIKAGEPVELTGTLRRAPEWSPEGFRFVVRVERLRQYGTEAEAPGVVEFFLPLTDGAHAVEDLSRAEYEALSLRRGARVRVMSQLAREGKFRNPGVSSFTAYLEERALDATATLKSPLLVERLDDERVFLPLVWLDGLRARLTERINRLFSPATAGMLNAALIGNRFGLARATAERFREGGTFHTLVISGLHITFIGGLIWWAAGRATRRQSVRFAVSILFVWIYVLMVGAEASVMRAALMFTAAALAPVLGRRAANLNALGGAALVLLVWRPSQLFAPSFQLSFLSVLLIIALAWPLLAKLKETGEWRPTRRTPYPPHCPERVRLLAETLFWSERAWQRERARQVYSYRLFKTPLAARLERWRVQRVLRYAFAACVVSACVQAGMLPLLVVYFHRLSLASFVLNIFAGAGLALVSLSALAVLLVAQLSEPLAAPLVGMVERGAWLVEHAVDPFTSAGAASLRLPEYTGAGAAIYLLYYIPLGALVWMLAGWRPLDARHDEDEETSRRREMRLRLAACSLAALAGIIILHPLSARRADGRLTVAFLDVGQGDAALVTMPDGATLLIDGGGRAFRQTPQNFRQTPETAEAIRAVDAFAPEVETQSAARFEREEALRFEREEAFERDVRSIGESVVSEYLWWRGLDRIDYVLATHADADHISGLADVMRNFRVRAALVARAPAGDVEFARFAATAREMRVPVFHIGAGDQLKFGAVSAEVLWPPLSSDGSGASRNDDSIVLRLRYGDRSILLTGDIESRGEAALLATAASALTSDAVKVAHHGSRTSSTESFVKAVRTALAVIPVGRDSPFGHPHAEVLGRWRDGGARILTTGERGTITLTTDGEKLEVETFVKP